MIDNAIQTSVHFEIYSREQIRSEKMLGILHPWSAETYLHPKHMIPHTPQWLQNNLHFAVVARTAESILVGAGGVTPVLSNGGKIEFEDQQVLELCSHFVYKDFQGQDIGLRNIIKRLRLVREHNGLPAVVTTQQGIIEIALKLGMVKTLDSKRYRPLGLSIRDCNCKNLQGDPFIGTRCSQCPEDGGKIIWVLPPEQKLPGDL